MFNVILPFLPHFTSFPPPLSLFSLLPSLSRLFETKAIPSEQIENYPDLASGPLDSVTLSVTCGDVNCLFEFVMYTFIGYQEEDAHSSDGELLQNISASPPPSNNSTLNQGQSGLLYRRSSPANDRQSFLQPLARSSPSRQSSDLILLSPPADDRDNRNIARQRESASNPSMASGPPNESGLNNVVAVSHSRAPLSSASVSTSV